MSKDKYGSRVVDSCWKHSELKDKQLIVDELLAGEKELADNYYGKFVMRNCNIEYYKKKGCLKEGSYSSKERVKRMFSDIVEKSMTVKSSRKRKSRDETSEELDYEEVGFVVKKKRLFEDEVRHYIIIQCYPLHYSFSLIKEEKHYGLKNQKLFTY